MLAGDPELKLILLLVSLLLLLLLLLLLGAALLEWIVMLAICDSRASDLC